MTTPTAGAETPLFPFSEAEFAAVMRAAFAGLRSGYAARAGDVTQIDYQDELDVVPESAESAALKLTSMLETAHADRRQVSALRRGLSHRVAFDENERELHQFVYGAEEHLRQAVVNMRCALQLLRDYAGSEL